MKKHIYLFSTSSHPDAISVNSLDIELLQPEIKFSLYDYFIITSKNASKALEKYAKDEFISKQAVCVSHQSALSYEVLGGSVLAVGEGYGDNLQTIIQAHAKETKWLYLRAKEIASPFVKELQKEGYNIDEKIVYESTCAKNLTKITINKESILIFTSPSSVKCFLKNNTINKASKVVVIGSTTALSLPKNIEYIISKEKNIASCIEIAKNL